MKKVTHIIVSLFCLVFVSCYKDLSTEADKIIPDIVITGLPEELNVVYGEEITLSVKAYMGAKTGDQLEYLWEVDITANDGNPRAEIGTESTLVYKVNNTPSVMSYLLDVRVTDPETGLQAIKSCKMSVGSSLGEGILVGYTNPDGVTSEFDIIASPQLTYGFTGSARVTRGDLAVAQKLQNLVRQIEQAEQICNGRAAFAHLFRNGFLCQPEIFDQRLICQRLFHGVQVLALHVLYDRHLRGL